MPEDNKKGITVKIDAALHAQVKEYVESHGMTMSDFIALACDDELHPKFKSKEEKKMENMRTVAFQVPEDLFQRIKDYLQRNNMSQRQFFLGLIETELDREQAEREAVCEAQNGENKLEGKVPVHGTESDVDGFTGDCDEPAEADDESEDESQGLSMGM